MCLSGRRFERPWVANALNARPLGRAAGACTRTMRERATRAQRTRGSEDRRHGGGKTAAPAGGRPGRGPWACAPDASAQKLMVFAQSLPDERGKGHGFARLTYTDRVRTRVGRGGADKTFLLRPRSRRRCGRPVGRLIRTRVEGETRAEASLIRPRRGTPSFGGFEKEKEGGRKSKTRGAHRSVSFSERALESSA